MNLQDAELGFWILLTLMGSTGSFLTLRLLTGLIRIQLEYPNRVEEVVEMSRHQRRSEVVRFITHLLYLALGLWVFSAQQFSLVPPPGGDAVAVILVLGYAAFSFNTVNEYILGRKLYDIRRTHIADTKSKKDIVE